MEWNGSASNDQNIILHQLFILVWQYDVTLSFQTSSVVWTSFSSQEIILNSRAKTPSSESLLTSLMYITIDNWNRGTVKFIHSAAIVIFSTKRYAECIEILHHKSSTMFAYWKWNVWTGCEKISVMFWKKMYPKFSESLEAYSFCTNF